MAARSLRLSRLLACAWWKAPSNIWSSGKALRTIIILGCLKWSWKMHSKQSVITLVPRQGWWEPGGGVVLETDLYCTRFMYLTCTSRCLCRGLYYYLYDFGILGDDYISWGSHFVCMCRPCRRSLGKLLWMSSSTLSVERCYLLELALIMFTHSLMILYLL